jgi:putative transcriptional regulator
MTNINYLSDQFLVAMPNLTDSQFSHTVSYLCQHNEEGALAVVINKTAGMTLGNILEQMGIACSIKQVNDCPIFAGGPVQQERGFIIHSKDSTVWDSSISVSESTSLTSSRDILESIAEGKGPKEYLVALGYAGWGANQLEIEMLNNVWLNSPYQEDILYNTPVEQRWMTAANQMGVNINQLTIPAGHG